MGQRSGVRIVFRRRRRTAILTKFQSASEKEKRHGQGHQTTPGAREAGQDPQVRVLLQEGQADIDYKDTALLRTYISERGKIRARRVTGNCVQHQRDIAIAVKNAREVALLPSARRRAEPQE